MITPRSSCAARRMSTCWRTSTRNESLKRSSSAPCWRLAAPTTCASAWCTPSICSFRDAAKPTKIALYWKSENSTHCVTAVLQRNRKPAREQADIQAGLEQNIWTSLHRFTVMTQRWCRWKCNAERDWKSLGKRNVAQWMLMGNKGLICTVGKEREDRGCWYECESYMLGFRACNETKAGLAPA